MGCQGPTRALEVPPLRFSEGVRNLGDHALFGGDLTHARLPAPVTTTRSRLRAADSARHARAFADVVTSGAAPWRSLGRTSSDRKSTRLNSSHGYISYAVFCLKKKKKSNE